MVLNREGGWTSGSPGGWGSVGNTGVALGLGGMVGVAGDCAVAKFGAADEEDFAAVTAPNCPKAGADAAEVGDGD